MWAPYVDDWGKTRIDRSLLETRSCARTSQKNDGGGAIERVNLEFDVDVNHIAALAESAAANELVKRFKDVENGPGYGDLWAKRIRDEIVDDLMSKFLGDSMGIIAEDVAKRLIRSSTFRDLVASKVAEKMRGDGGDD